MSVALPVACITLPCNIESQRVCSGWIVAPDRVTYVTAGRDRGKR